MTTVWLIRGTDKRITPSRLLLLKQLNTTAEECLFGSTGAVITARFDDAQRQATKDAANRVSRCFVRSMSPLPLHLRMGFKPGPRVAKWLCMIWVAVPSMSPS